MLTSYAPARWKKGLNVMLQRQVGSINEEKLHIIFLFKADFNMNNKWMGRAIMFAVESPRHLPPNNMAAGKEEKWQMCIV